MNFSKIEEVCIGIFDSGVGGLTVAAQIKKFIPNSRIIYIGDYARVPWGVRSPRVVNEFASQLLKFLETKGVSHIVVACHTASAVALPLLRRIAKVPITGVIEPTVDFIVKSHNGRIGVLATPTTIASGVWEKAIKRKNKKIKVLSKAAALLVPIVEAGLEDHKVAHLLVKEYITPFIRIRRGIDTLVLACTHYPLLLPVFRKMLPDIKLVNPGEVTAEHLASVIGNGIKSNSKDEFYFTDLSETVKNQVKRFFDSEVSYLKEVKVDGLFYNSLPRRKFINEIFK